MRKRVDIDEDLQVTIFITGPSFLGAQIHKRKFHICEDSVGIWLLFMFSNATPIGFLSSVLKFMLQGLITIL